MGENPENNGKKFGNDLKIIIVGDMSTGKTSIIRRYIDGVFENTNKATIAPNFSSKIIKTNDVIYRLQFWDIPGQDRNPTLNGLFCHDAQGVIFCCDITNKKSRDNLKKWYESVKNFKDIENTPKILLENKCDLIKEEINDNEDINSLKKVSDELQCINFFRTSALNGYNINESIDFLINDIINSLDSKDIQVYQSFMVKTAKKEDKTKCC